MRYMSFALGNLVPLQNSTAAGITIAAWPRLMRFLATSLPDFLGVASFVASVTCLPDTGGCLRCLSSHDDDMLCSVFAAGLGNVRAKSKRVTLEEPAFWPHVEEFRTGPYRG